MDEKIKERFEYWMAQAGLGISPEAALVLASQVCYAAFHALDDCGKEKPETRLLKEAESVLFDLANPEPEEALPEPKPERCKWNCPESCSCSTRKCPED